MMIQILSFFQGGMPVVFGDSFIFIAALHILAFCLVPRKNPERT